MDVLLRDLPKSDLPRERLMRFGASNLSNQELLSIILRCGTKSVSVSTLSNNILSSIGDISNLRDMSVNKLSLIHGIGDVKAITLLASIELGKRVYEDYSIKDEVKIRNSLDAYLYFGKYIKSSKQENLLVIYLDNQKKYISHEIVFKGTIDKSIVHPREIFKKAYLESASAIIIMHNHPGGTLKPSNQDNEMTKNIVEVGNILGIVVLDHIIVSNKGYYSYIEKGDIRYE